jgi:hypothetical protein
VTLLETVRELASLDREGVICATEPFTQKSEVIIVTSSESGSVKEMERPGFKYFLEVLIAQEIIEDWINSVAKKPTVQEQCERLIHYAIFDG